jgi:hypothetical protein
MSRMRLSKIFWLQYMLGRTQRQHAASSARAGAWAWPIYRTRSELAPGCSSLMVRLPTMVATAPVPHAASWLLALFLLCSAQIGEAPPTPATRPTAPFPAIITVKTTAHNHASRVAFSLSSWLSNQIPAPAAAASAVHYDLQAARDSVVFVTDVDMAAAQRKWAVDPDPSDDPAGVGQLMSTLDAAALHRRFVDSGCVLDRHWMQNPPEGSTEMNKHLVCKTIAEMKAAEQRMADVDTINWWCHFDDVRWAWTPARRCGRADTSLAVQDQYVLLDSLAALLGEQQRRVADRMGGSAGLIGALQSSSGRMGNLGQDLKARLPWNEGHAFLGRTNGGPHATGGAGYCIDRGSVRELRESMEKWCEQLFCASL